MAITHEVHDIHQKQWQLLRYIYHLVDLCSINTFSSHEQNNWTLLPNPPRIKCKLSNSQKKILKENCSFLSRRGAEYNFNLFDVASYLLCCIGYTTPAAASDLLCCIETVLNITQQLTTHSIWYFFLHLAASQELQRGRGASRFHFGSNAGNYRVRKRASSWQLGGEAFEITVEHASKYSGDPTWQRKCAFRGSLAVCALRTGYSARSREKKRTALLDVRLLHVRVETRAPLVAGIESVPLVRMGEKVCKDAAARVVKGTRG